MSGGDTVTSPDDDADAYYAQLIARVDDTISETHDSTGISVAGDPQAAVVRALKEHSFVGVFFYDAPTPFGTAPRVYMLALSILTILTLSLIGGGGNPWFAWMVITFIWQLLNAFVRGVLKRRHLSARFHAWPVGAVVIIVVQLLISLPLLADYGESRPDQLDASLSVFLAVWTTNLVVEFIALGMNYYTGGFPTIFDHPFFSNDDGGASYNDEGADTGGYVGNADII